MKKTCITIVVICLVSAAFAQKGYTINGTLQQMNYSAAKVYLMYNGHKDSAVVKNGKYQLKGVVPGPTRVSMLLRTMDKSGKSYMAPILQRDNFGFFLENSNVSIVSIDSFSNATIKGSVSNDEFQKINAMNKDLDAQILRLSRQFNACRTARDSAGMNRIKDESAKVQEAIRNNYVKYLQSNPNSPLGLWAVNRYAIYNGLEINATEVEPVFMLLPEQTRNSEGGKVMAQKIHAAKMTGIGVLAQDFTQNDTLGNPVSLSSFRGKYLLLDFWADWCFPCRKENPNLVAAYRKYNADGFEILSVGLEKPDARAKWMKAIHDDKLTWTHVSDMKYWDNAAARMYGVEVVPMNFLIDPAGKIIAKDLKGEQLHKKLSEIFQQ